MRKQCVVEFSGVVRCIDSTGSAVAIGQKTIISCGDANESFKGKIDCSTLDDELAVIFPNNILSVLVAHIIKISEGFKLLTIKYSAIDSVILNHRDELTLFGSS